MPRGRFRVSPGDNEYRVCLEKTSKKMSVFDKTGLDCAAAAKTGGQRGEIWKSSYSIRFLSAASDRDADAETNQFIPIITVSSC